MNDTIAKVVEALKTRVSEIHYNNWIRPTVFHSPSLGILRIRVPNRFIRDWITDNYLALIQYEIFKITGTEHEVLFDLIPEEEAAPTEPAFSPSSALKSAPSPEVQRSLHLFSSKYSFNAFVVGNSNQFAHAAALAVASAPAMAYNPFLIYGGVGLGKTHLLRAIGHSILHKNPAARIIYTTGENFTNELIDAIKQEKMFDFRKKYRDSCDVFLVDDVQFIAGKEKTQEEFFHTFNSLYESRRQIVLTTDKPPREISALEDRLRSRFEWGLIADIQAPDTETRAAILKKKAERDQVVLPDDVALFLASHIRSNVRELEGSLIRISAFASLSRSEITLDLAKEVLKDLRPHSSKTLMVEDIQKMVSERYQIKISEMKSDRRMKALTVPRQIAMYLCRKHVKASFPELGMKFGGKDHSTIVHAVQKVEKLLSENLELRKEIESIEKSLQIESPSH